MFKIKMLCFDVGNPVPYEDEPTFNGPFSTRKDAYDAAYKMAEDEVESLSDGCAEGVSFGIVEDEDKDCIRVNYYYNEENDTTGNTEQVTVYWVEEINKELDDANKKLKDKYGQNITIHIESYEEDDGSTWYRYFYCDGIEETWDGFKTIDEAYRSADFYLASI